LPAVNNCPVGEFAQSGLPDPKSIIVMLLCTRLPDPAAFRRLLRVVRLLGERQLAKHLPRRLVPLQEAEAAASKVLRRKRFQVRKSFYFILLFKK
jgi:hypothetical protein